MNSFVGDGSKVIKRRSTVTPKPNSTPGINQKSKKLSETGLFPSIFYLANIGFAIFIYFEPLYGFNIYYIFQFVLYSCTNIGFKRCLGIGKG